MYLYKCMGTPLNYLSSFVTLGWMAGKEDGFITCAGTGRIWFNANEHGEP